MIKNLSTTSDKIKLLGIGNTYNPIIFLISFLLASGFVAVNSDLLGYSGGVIVFAGILYIGYFLQRYLYRKIKDTIISNIELIQEYEVDISNDICALIAVMQKDTKTRGINRNTIHAIHQSLISISNKTEKFHHKLRSLDFFSSIILATDESSIIHSLKGLISEGEDYLRKFLINQMEILSNGLYHWTNKHKTDLIDLGNSLNHIESKGTLSGGGALQAASKRLKLYASSIEKIYI